MTVGLACLAIFGGTAVFDAILVGITCFANN